MWRRDDSGDFYVYFCSDNVAPSNEAIYIAFVVKPKFILPICGCVMILQRRAVESKHNLENSQCHRRYIQHNTALCYALYFRHHTDILLLLLRQCSRKSIGHNWKKKYNGFYHDVFGFHISWGRWGQTWWRRQQKNH